MPFRVTPKASLSATSPACRAVVATRLAAPELEVAAFRALQFAQFTTTGVLRGARRRCAPRSPPSPGLDAAAIVARDRRRRRPRRLRGRPRPRAHRRRLADRVPGPRGQQRRRGALHGAVADLRRPTTGAPRGRRLSAGRGLRRRRRQPRPDAHAPPAGRGSRSRCCAAFAYPLATAEVAAIMTPHLVAPDPAGAERALIEAVADGPRRRIARPATARSGRSPPDARAAPLRGCRRGVVRQRPQDQQPDERRAREHDDRQRGWRRTSTARAPSCSEQDRAAPQHERAEARRELADERVERRSPRRGAPAGTSRRRKTRSTADSEPSTIPTSGPTTHSSAPDPVARLGEQRRRSRSRASRR